MTWHPGRRLAVAAIGLAAVCGCGKDVAPVPGGPAAGGPPPGPAAADVKPAKTIALNGKGWANSVGISPDGKRVFGGLGDAEDKFQLWAVDAPKLLLAKGSFGGQNGVAAVSPAGTLAAYPTGRGRLVLIDLTTGAELRELKRTDGGLADYIPAVRFTAKGDVVAVNSRDTIVGLDTATGNEVFACENGAELFRLSGFLDGGRKIASSGPSGVVKVWDVTTGKVATTLDAGPGDVGHLEASADGKWLATSAGGEIKIWDTATWKKVREVAPWGGMYGGMAFIPNSTLLAYTAGTATDISLVDVTTGAGKGPLKGHPNTVSAIGVSPDGKTLVTAGRGDGLVLLWDLQQLP